MGEPALTRRVFTIQLKATKSPIDVNRIFPGYKGVQEIVADDGFYKYVYGEYNSVAKAREALAGIKENYEDAFIREMNVPLNK